MPTRSEAQAAALVRIRAHHAHASRQGGAAGLALLCVAALAPPAASGADSLAVRVEVGAASDVSNEQFYESAIDDTTFLGRRLHNTPETRLAAVALAEVLRTWSDGRWQVRFAPDASVGDKAVRFGAAAALQGRPTELSRVSLEPRAEYRRDESFGLLRRDWRASLTARARRLSLDEMGALRVSAGSEVVRAIEGSGPFVLSGTSARAAVGYERSPIFGPEWDAEYGAIARVYRDSTDRDHVEHRLGISLREYSERGHQFSIHADADRRLALRDPDGTRDRFLRLHTQAGAGLEVGQGWTLRPDLRAEFVRFDEPDSVVDFDYQLYGAQLGFHRELGADLGAGTGPRVERLVAPWCPAEEYLELAWTFELERFTPSAWWSLAPLAGHRRYERSTGSLRPGDPEAPAVHSSFDFAELGGFLDQKLPAGMRVRAMGTLRAERHTDPDHDARSLYFSLDVRRLF